MNLPSKPKLIFYLAAIFLAGGVTGATVAVKATKQIMAEPPKTGHIEAQYLKERFQAKLDLTPEQAKLIDPLLDKMSDELKAIHGECGKRISAVVKNSYDQIARELTPAQRLKLEQMRKSRPEKSRRHGRDDAR